MTTVRHLGTALMPVLRKTRCRLCFIPFVFTLALLVPWAAKAVPSYARQTGLSCTACHQGYLALNNYGRQFKVSGYTASSGETLLPPLAVYLQPSLTITNKGQPGGAAPHFGDNNNFAFTQVSLFYAGRLFGPYLDKIGDGPVETFLNKFGTYIQTTFDGVARTYSWDNSEIRYADLGKLFGQRLDYGFFVNNNPTLEDPYNTLPAWRYPFSSSGLAPTPSAATLIEGGLSQEVLGLGGYVLISKSVYLDLAGYHTLTTSFQRAMGVDPTGEPLVSDVAPSWRVAYQKTIDKQFLETGFFGLYADTYPGRDKSHGHDHTLDLGVDAMYQTSLGKHDFLAAGSVIYELDDFAASQALGNTTNRHDRLLSTNLVADYLYDKTYGGDVSYFISNGTHDTALYADGKTGSPLSDGFILEAKWLPFNKRGGPAFWPKSNVKFSAQYTIYNHFNGSRRNYDGAGRGSFDNNTLYLEAWIAF